MKRIPLIIAIILCLCGQAWPCDGDLCKAPIQLARMNPYVAGAVAVDVACTTANDSDLISYMTDTGIQSAMNAAWIGVQVKPAAQFTLTAYYLKCADYETSGTATIQLYTDSTNTRGDAVEGTDATFDLHTYCSHGTDATGATPFEVALATPKTGLAAGTYWVSITLGAGDYIRLDGAAHVGVYIYVPTNYTNGFAHALAIRGCTE